MAKAAVKTSNKNNPNARGETKDMFFGGKKVKGVKIVGLAATLSDGKIITRKSYIAIADAVNEDLFLDEEGIPYEFKHARPQA